MATVPRQVLLLERRLAAFRRHLPAALDGDEKAVHQARVATRRLREALPVVGADLPRRRVRKAVRRVRRITRALGPVREMDVALGVLDEIAAVDPDCAAGAVLARREVAAERERRRGRMLDAMAGRRPRKAVAAVEDVLARLAVAGNGAWRGELARRIIDRAEALRRALEEAGVLYSAPRLHAVRIAVKKLRYALELAGEVRLAPVRLAVGRLKQAQDLLGRLHDLDVVAAHARAAQVPAAAADRAALERLLGRLQDECRQLHARYLQRRKGLMAVADQAREVVAPRLARPASARSGLAGQIEATAASDGRPESHGDV
jgi:CHAD domain-containing protein